MKRRVLILLGLIILNLLPVLSQQRKITGVITSAEDSLPMAGVSVIVTGTQVGTISDLEGRYSIDIPADAITLEFRFVGMETIIREIGAAGNINVIMKPQAYTVDELVVTALGISRDAKSLGYSVTAVKNDELTKGKDRSALNALQGKIAGVNITSASGAPGASTRVLVRGVTSLSGGNQPLFIIDGVPVSNSSSGSSSINGGTDFGNKVNDINPEDIESVSVLKGASGTALYGSRAANGVIIITTKKGQNATKTTVDVSSTVGFEEPLRLIDYQNVYGQGIQGNLVLYENMSWGPEFDGVLRPWGHNVDGMLRVKPYRALPDNVKDFFETGMSLSNSVSITGGNEQTSYYFSYSNMFWDGIFPTGSDSYKKHNISLRSAHKYSERFGISSSLNYVKKINSSVPTGQGEQSVYNQVMQTPRDISLLEIADIDSIWNNVDNHYSLYTINPYQILKKNGNRNDEDRIYGSLDLDYKISTPFSLKWRLGGDVSNEQRKSWRSRVEPEGNNEFSAVFDPGSVGESSRYAHQLNSDIILTFTKQVSDWTFNALAGQALNERRSRSLSTSVSFLAAEDFYNLSNSTEKPFSSESFYLIRSVGVYGNADAAYKSLLFMSVSARNEWSSTLPPQNNSFFFPGGNISFIFTELLPDIRSVLPYAKLRASWAKVGNDAPPYSVYSSFTKGSHSDGFGGMSYPLPNGVNSYDVGDLIANEELRPEITTEYELGADLRFFSNRIGIDFTYYDKKTTDLIWPSPVPYSSGYRWQMQNLGRITNKGIELLVSLTPIKTSSFEWNIAVNYTKNHNNLDYLNNQLEEAELNALRVDGGMQMTWLAIPGYPIGVYKARTIMTTDDGKVVVDNQGLPKTAEDLKIYGNSQSKYYGGVTTSLRYKGLIVSANLDFRVGGIMYSRTKNISIWAGTVPVTLYNDREPFIIPNSVYEIGKNESVESIYEENTIPLDRVHIVDYWGEGGMDSDGSALLDKSFAKLRQVSLSYAIPKKLYENFPVESIDIGVVGKNLLLFTPKGQTYIDPELTTFGNDLQADFGEYGAQPSVRSISFSIHVTL